jgi:hypothetical protein
MEQPMPPLADPTLRTSIGLSAIAACCLLAAAPANSQPPVGGYRDDPPPPCNVFEAPQHVGSDFFEAVAGDPTAYLTCNNEAPQEINYCPAGSTFDLAQQSCILQHGATLSLDNISQDPFDPNSCGDQCWPRPPVNVTVTYSATNLDNINLDLVSIEVEVHGLTGGSFFFGDNATGDTNGGDRPPRQQPIVTKADGRPHAIVIAARPTLPSGAAFLPAPGQQVLVDARLSYHPTTWQPGLGPTVPPVGVSTMRVFTVPAPPP